MRVWDAATSVEVRSASEFPVSRHAWTQPIEDFLRRFVNTTRTGTLMRQFEDSFQITPLLPALRRLLRSSCNGALQDTFMNILKRLTKHGDTPRR